MVSECLQLGFLPENFERGAGSSGPILLVMTPQPVPENMG